MLLKRAFCRDSSGLYTGAIPICGMGSERWRVASDNRTDGSVPMMKEVAGPASRTLPSSPTNESTTHPASPRRPHLSDCTTARSLSRITQSGLGEDGGLSAARVRNVHNALDKTTSTVGTVENEEERERRVGESRTRTRNTKTDNRFLLKKGNQVNTIASEFGEWLSLSYSGLNRTRTWELR